MSYSDFSLAALQKTFGIASRMEPLFRAAGDVKPTSWLVESLGKGRELAPASEKARSEFIVAPVLMECRELSRKKFQVFSGVRLDADPELGLKGECDFILSPSPSIYVLQAPQFVILEAKKNDIEEGVGQCAAQMLGAQVFNKREQTQDVPVYGCVTTGEAWQFMKLEGMHLLIDETRYFINELGKILWILSEIIKSFPPLPSTEAA